MIWRCSDCGKNTHTASTMDPHRCFRCAAVYYAWRVVAFGKLRKVPPRHAARWT